MIRIFKKTLIGPTGVALGLVFFLASCDVTSPSVVVTNLGPSVKCEFLTGTNLVKVGVSRYFGSGVFSPSAEFSRLSANDVNPTPYAVLPTPTNYVVGYAYWTGSDWSSWVVTYTTTYSLSNNLNYTVYLSGDYANLSGGTGTLTLSKD